MLPSRTSITTTTLKYSLVDLLSLPLLYPVAVLVVYELPFNLDLDLSALVVGPTAVDEIITDERSF